MQRNFCFHVSNDSRLSYKVNLYPNPVQNILKVNYTLKQPTKVVLKVMNSLGEPLITEEIQYTDIDFSHTINTQTLNPGTYIIQLLTDYGIANNKFIKL